MIITLHSYGQSVTQEPQVQHSKYDTMVGKSPPRSCLPLRVSSPLPSEIGAPLPPHSVPHGWYLCSCGHLLRSTGHHTQSIEREDTQLPSADSRLQQDKSHTAGQFGAHITPRFPLLLLWRSVYRQHHPCGPRWRWGFVQ